MFFLTKDKIKTILPTEKTFGSKAVRAWPIEHLDMIVILTNHGYKLCKYPDGIYDIPHVFDDSVNPDNIVTGYDDIGYYQGNVLTVYSFQCPYFPKTTKYRFDDDITWADLKTKKVVTGSRAYHLGNNEIELPDNKPIKQLAYFECPLEEHGFEVLCVLYQDGTVYDICNRDYLDVEPIDKIKTFEGHGLMLITDKNDAYLYDDTINKFGKVSDIINSEDISVVISENTLSIYDYQLDDYIVQFSNDVKRATIHNDTIYVELVTKKIYRLSMHDKYVSKSIRNITLID